MTDGWDQVITETDEAVQAWVGAVVGGATKVSSLPHPVSRPRRSRCAPTCVPRACATGARARASVSVLRPLPGDQLGERPPTSTACWDGWSARRWRSASTRSISRHRRTTCGARSASRPDPLSSCRCPCACSARQSRRRWCSSRCSAPSRPPPSVAACWARTTSRSRARWSSTRIFPTSPPGTDPLARVVPFQHGARRRRQSDHHRLRQGEAAALAVSDEGRNKPMVIRFVTKEA